MLKIYPLPVFLTVVFFFSPFQKDTLIVGEAFDVGGGSYAKYQIHVAETMENVRAVGDFRATNKDGAKERGAEIEVFIVDEKGLTAFQRGQPFTPYYRSGKVSAGEINVSLGPGTYHLVFSNMSSVGGADKSVTAKVALRYV